MGRLEQLMKTLIKNLTDCFYYNDKVEFVLVVFLKKETDEDGLQILDWIKTHVDKKFYLNGFFKVFYTTKLKYWHNCIAKNTAHKMGSGNFLINLDCDNFVTPQEIGFILSKKFAFKVKCNYCSKRHQIYCKLKGHCKCILNCKYCNLLKNKKSRSYNFIYWGFSHKYIHDGTFGEVGMLRNIFFRLGGYNESFKPMGGADLDLLKRAISFSRSSLLKYTERTAISNDKNEGLKNTNEYNKVSGNKRKAHSLWKKYNDYNMKISKAMLFSKKYCIRQKLGVDVIRFL
tara:strand:- start:62 stop:922 length:861 start_codon:yes stop_codon:yes gene_type:complete